MQPQPELFQELGAPPRPRRFQMPLFPSRFLRLRVAYEDLVFAALGLVLLLLGGFILGVERGKQLAGGALDLPRVPAVGPVVKEELPVAAAEGGRTRPGGALAAAEGGRTRPGGALAAAAMAVPSGALRAASTAPESSGARYAIQLASYLDPKPAAAEAQRLIRKGFKAQVVRQGRYYELRVVGFGSREQASVSLTALRRTYRDGFVKRLSTG